MFIHFKTRTRRKCLRTRRECQRATLAKVKKHITHPRRLVKVLSHCQWVLFTADPSAFSFPLPSATGSLLFLDPPLQMIYFSLFFFFFFFFFPILQAIQGAIQFCRFSTALQTGYIYLAKHLMSCCVLSLLFSCLTEWNVLHQRGSLKTFIHLLRYCLQETVWPSSTFVVQFYYITISFFTIQAA